MFAPGVCEAVPPDTMSHSCIGGSFDANTSSSYHLVLPGQFYIEYGDESDASGDYFTDNFTISGVTIRNLTMAVANETSGNFLGILGIGYRANEAITEELADDSDDSEDGESSYPILTVDGDRVNSSTTPTAPTLLDQMVSQGIINGQSYSLYLDDLAASTGTILFGGIDHAKYTGDLISLPVQTEMGGHLELQIEWSSIGLTDASGSTVLNPETFPGNALLDSGTPFITVPYAVYEQLAGYFAVAENYDVESDLGTGPLVNCTMVPTNGTLDFGFAGPNGPVIAVPFSELTLPLYQGETQLRFDDGSPACQFAVQPSDELGYARAHRRGRKDSDSDDDDGSDGDPDIEAQDDAPSPSNNPDALTQYILGDPFMRSAYIVFDIANNAIALAQTNFSAGTDSNIEEIGGGDQPNPSAVPGVASTATESYQAPMTSDPFDEPEISTITNSAGATQTVEDGWILPGGNFSGVGVGSGYAYAPAFPNKAPATSDTLMPTGSLAEPPFTKIPATPTPTYTPYGTPTPYHGDGGDEGGYEDVYTPITTPVGAVPTARSTTGVSGRATSYSQEAVTALMGKAGRVAGASGTGGTVDAGLATATGVPGNAGEGKKGAAGRAGVSLGALVVMSGAVGGMLMW